MCLFDVHTDKIVKLKAENKELEELLGELYDEVSYEWGGEWVIENKNLQKKIKQVLGNK
ncbi:hypothetical protein LCGC14_0404460 [marine sediment metagenome]|uniref:Uncharacterized protein n=1 Tax=marine sediment metagenome TaxID=412755 RepID=A0A0F9TDZ4_9ZZZZ